MYKQDLALNNHQWLICHKIRLNHAKEYNLLYYSPKFILIPSTTRLKTENKFNFLTFLNYRFLNAPKLLYPLIESFNKLDGFCLRSRQ